MSLRFTLLLLLSGVLICAPVFVVAQDTTEVPSPPAGLTIYVVQRGDTLFAIAQLYETSVSQLVTLNGLSDASRIDVGQRLLVPADNFEPEPQLHVVQPGETLFSIAQFYNTSVETLVEFNGLADPNDVFAGQALVIVPEFATSESAVETGDVNLPTLSSNIHLVQPGETLFRIATFYGLSVQELASANSITDPTVIYAGQQLIIPNLPERQIEAIDLPAPLNTLSVRPLLLVEGETGVIELSTSQSSAVTGTFLGRSLAFVALDNNTRHIAFFGIPIFTEANIYIVNLTLTNADGTETNFAFNIRIAEGIYETQNIDVADEQLTAPAVQDNELALLSNLTSAVTLERPWTDPFSLPAAAAMNSPFGTSRSYNGGPVSTYHTGSDFASAPNTPVFAAASGTVVLVDALNIRGNAVVIDHGWGIYSVYAHLTEFRVALGERVTTGQTIGTAGSTGRVNGPHLHWEIWVNGVPVNPITWTQSVFPS